MSQRITVSDEALAKRRGKSLHLSLCSLLGSGKLGFHFLAGVAQCLLHDVVL